MSEECGLRCVYHGWKCAVHADRVDMPTEPTEALQSEIYNVRAVDMVSAEPDFCRFMDLYADEAVGKV